MASSIQMATATGPITGATGLAHGDHVHAKAADHSAKVSGVRAKVSGIREHLTSKKNGNSSSMKMDGAL